MSEKKCCCAERNKLRTQEEKNNLEKRVNRIIGQMNGIKKMIEDTKERAMRCPNCGNLVYPRINPVVIVAIKNDQDELLVTKYAHASYSKFALVAGFIEIGETSEEAAIREAKEETGLDITDLKFYKDQPWRIFRRLSGNGWTG